MSLKQLKRKKGVTVPFPTVRAIVVVFLVGIVFIGLAILFFQKGLPTQWERLSEQIREFIKDISSIKVGF